MIYRSMRNGFLDYARKRRPGSHTMQRFCQVLLSAYDNHSKRPEQNGEYNLLTELSQDKLSVIFDVGANLGNWTLYARQLFPAADFHCFEPVEETAQKLRTRVGSFAQVTAAAMSDSKGQAVIRSFADDSAISTLTPSSALRLGLGDTGSENYCNVVRGDDYCASLAIEKVDFLKIDTEGHELKVLSGFRRMLQDKQVGIIQFEHNHYAAMNRVFLYDVVKLLCDNYTMFQLLPVGIRRIEYSSAEEHFRMRTFVAIVKGEQALRKWVIE